MGRLHKDYEWGISRFTDLRRSVWSSNADWNDWPVPAHIIRSRGQSTEHFPNFSPFPNLFHSASDWQIWCRQITRWIVSCFSKDIFACLLPYYSAIKTAFWRPHVQNQNYKVINSYNLFKCSHIFALIVQSSIYMF